MNYTYFVAVMKAPESGELVVFDTYKKALVAEANGYKLVSMRGAIIH